MKVLSWRNMMDTQFIAVYNLIKNDILRLAFSFTRNLSDAEDVTQEVFIKLYENFSKFNDIEHIKKWCIKVTINKCKNLFLSAWKKKITLLAEKEGKQVYQNLVDDSDNILEALLRLPKKYRVSIVLYYYEGFKVKEIANILNTNESTIRTRLQRAKNQLQKILREEENDD